MKFVQQWGGIVVLGLLVHSVNGASAEGPPSAVSSVMKLLQSGRVPESRLGPIIEQIARRGNEQDLAYLFDQCLHNEIYEGPLRLHTLKLLEEAASDRRVVPAGDLSALVELIPSDEGPDDAVRLIAIRLAGLWKVESALGILHTLVTAETTQERERQTALRALASIGGDVARSTLQQLTGSEHGMPTRIQAVANLVALDVDDAARRAAQVCHDMATDHDPGPLVQAFLDRQGGSDKLASALEASPPSSDVAKLAMRAMYAVGRSDPALSKVLGKAAGIDADPIPPTAEEIQELVTRVQAEGDASRGEDVFRRADLSCMKCHAISKAGGQIGPDLSAVGATSPVDYLLNSLYDPDQQIKEAFQTRVVMTCDGLVLHGIIIDSSEERLVLKDASGKLLSIPTDDIEASMAGKSLMPKGLTKFMTQGEVLDLVRFLSMLGRPDSDYAIRTTPRMQRWRLVQRAGEQFVDGFLNAAELQNQLGESPLAVPLYSRTNGDLLLDEAVTLCGESVVHIVGEFEVTESGDVGIKLDEREGVTMWVDDQPVDSSEVVVTRERGRHLIVLRIDTDQRTRSTLRLELFRVPGSRAEFTVIDGA